MPDNRLSRDNDNRDAYISNFHRKSLRLPNHDYRSPGVWHIIICAKGIGGRGPIFVHPVLRQLLQTNWLDLPLRFPSIYLEGLVIMSDHIHFIIWMKKWPGRLPEAKAPELWQVVQAYKSKVAVEWIDYVKKNHPNQSAKIWQPKYVERTVRLGDIERVRLYIRANPDQAEQSTNAGWETLYAYMDWPGPATSL